MNNKLFKSVFKQLFKKSTIPKFRFGFCTEKNPFNDIKQEPNNQQMSSYFDNFRKEYYNNFKQDVNDLLDEMNKKKYNTRLFGLVMFGIFGYATYGIFRNQISKEVVVISTKTYDDPEFKKATEECLIQLMKSPTVQDNVSIVLKNAVIDTIKNKDIKDELGKMFEEILSTSSFKKQAAITSNEIITELINNPEYEPMRNSVSEYLKTEIEKQLKDETNNKNADAFVKELIRVQLNDTENVKLTSAFINNALWGTLPSWTKEK
jgi:hypothetical protein